MSDRTAQNKEENDRTYRLSQEQRKLERDIRYAQRKAAMLDAAGDTEGFDAEALKIKNAQAKYNAFCKQTGRAKRLDRTRVYEYNNNIDNKVSAANREREKNIFTVRSGDYQKGISSSGLPKVIKLPNETLKQTVDVDLPNMRAVVPKGAELSSVVIIAGAGTRTPIKDIQRLVSKYPSFGDANGWQKKSGFVITDNFSYEVHWYENNGGVPTGEVKTKEVKRV